jgi:hypothetical protein
MAVPGVDDEVIQELFTEKYVTIYDLDDEVKMLLVAEALKADNVLVKYLFLDSVNGNLSLRAALALQDAFRVNATMEELELNLDQDHLSILFEGVAASQSIRSLGVYNPGVSISVQDIAAFANLDMLELMYCAFGVGAFTAFMAALMPNGRLHGLQNLKLCECNIDSTQFEEIAQMLRCNTSLKELNFGDNGEIPIGDEGCSLANALLDNKTLTKLYLNGRGIGDIGAIALAGLLNKNATIEDLHLQNNPAVTDKGKQALLKASLWNTSLEVLQIDGLGDADQQRMSRTLEINLFRKMYLEQDRATVSPYLYPHIFAAVSEKPSALFLFLQESREMFIPHLRDPSSPALHEPTFQEQLAWSKDQLTAKDGKITALMEENDGKIAALMEENAALNEKNAALNAEIVALKKKAASSRSARKRRTPS